MEASSLRACITTSCICLLLLAAHGSRVARYSYVGCFVDLTDNIRDVTGLNAIIKIDGFVPEKNVYGFSTGNMTRDLCSGVCSLGGFAYFAVQFSAYCFCGNSHGSQGAAVESTCNMACSGNPLEICGGASRNSVYAQNYVYPDNFVAADRTFVSVNASTYTEPTFWIISARDLTDCLCHCNAGCQAAIFSQQQSLCHLLRFAAVPSDLVNATGEFFVRA